MTAATGPAGRGGVVGDRGRGVIAGTLLGSTGPQLLRHAGRPVLIVRPAPA
ncbi:universal stress protein [Actinoplanes sp. G11-F43]|uniref:universal stress protein n=1 Tax=Actinoplanes sp. G11-F43 TaxID=3424130 RepID=UPI003D34CE5D